MENDENFYNNLVTLLKLFKNRPYHLSKYLMDNSALSVNFIKKLSNNNSLEKIEEMLSSDDNIDFYISDISKMDDFYKSFLNENIDKKELEKELKERLSILIKEERYEEAAELRDYIKMIDKK